MPLIIYYLNLSKADFLIRNFLLTIILYFHIKGGLIQLKHN